MMKMVKKMYTKIRILFFIIFSDLVELDNKAKYNEVKACGLRIYKTKQKILLVYDGIIVAEFLECPIIIYQAKKLRYIISADKRNYYIDNDSIKEVFPDFSLMRKVEDFYFFFDDTENHLVIYDDENNVTLFSGTAEHYTYMKRYKLLFICKNRIWNVAYYKEAEHRFRIDEDKEFIFCPDEALDVQLIGSTFYMLGYGCVNQLEKYDYVEKLEWLGNDVYLACNKDKYYILKTGEQYGTKHIKEVEITGKKLTPVECNIRLRYFIAENKENNTVTIYEIEDFNKFEIKELKTYEASEVKVEDLVFDAETGEFITRLIFYVPVPAADM